MWRRRATAGNSTPSPRTCSTPSACPGGKIAVYTGILVGRADRRRAGRRDRPRGGARTGPPQRRARSATRSCWPAALAGGEHRRSVATSRSTSGATSIAAPMAIAALGAGASVGILMPMSRGQEWRADHIGLVLMALAGYDPHEAAQPVGAHAGKQPASRIGQWFSTHPTDDTRIAEHQAWVPEAMKYTAPNKPVTDRLEYDATGLPARCPCCAPTARCASSGPGGLLTVRATDTAPSSDFPAYCRQTGHELVSTSREGEVLVFVIRKEVASHADIQLQDHRQPRRVRQARARARRPQRADEGWQGERCAPASSALRPP